MKINTHVYHTKKKLSRTGKYNLYFPGSPAGYTMELHNGISIYEGVLFQRCVIKILLVASTVKLSNLLNFTEFIMSFF